MLEMTFVLLPFLAILCAFFDLSLAVYRWTTLQNASREGCRYAVTFQRQSGLGQDASIKQVVQYYSLGLVSASASPAQVEVKYFSPGAPDTEITTGGNIPGNIVEVVIPDRTFTWIAPLSGTFVNPLWTTSPLRISVRSSDVLGGYPVGVTSVPR